MKRASKPVHIGWMAPLLGLFVVLELTGFWAAGYQLRGRLSADPLTLYAVLAIFGTYYFAATLIFPSDPEQWPDFDAWYERQKRMIVGAMLTAYMLGIAGQTGSTSSVRSPSPSRSATRRCWSG
ncbi:hypothetical protein [Sphingosinicella sp.]|uniref:hypothetical protein n=1 Tax=Sphingosinicella sp. TaxID=1917971 RepID=UPI004037A3EB